MPGWTGDKWWAILILGIVLGVLLSEIIFLSLPALGLAGFIKEYGSALAAFTTFLAIVWAWKMHKEVIEQGNIERKQVQENLKLYVLHEIMEFCNHLNNYYNCTAYGKGKEARENSTNNEDDLRYLKTLLNQFIPIPIGTIIGNPEYILKMSPHYSSEVITLAELINRVNKKAQIILASNWHAGHRHDLDRLRSTLFDDLEQARNKANEILGKMKPSKL